MLFPKITERVKRLVHCTAFGHLPLTPVALGLSAQGPGQSRSAPQVQLGGLLTHPLEWAVPGGCGWSSSPSGIC